jgi:nucleoside-diphosphate-sugar epimerase
MNNAAQPKIYVAGYRGMVGSALVRDLLAQGVASEKMSPHSEDEFSFKVSPEVRVALHQLAALQGRQLQAILDEALREYLEREQRDHPRQHVISEFALSLNEFDELYKDLAK